MSSYTGPSARAWKPRNLGGKTYYDPRDELKFWAAGRQNEWPLGDRPR